MGAGQAIKPVTAKTSDLKDVGVPRVLYGLLSQRFTGRVRFTSADGQAHALVLSGGIVVAVEGQSSAHRLGEILVESRALSAAQLDRTLASQTKSGGRRLGELLREAGLVDALGLERALRVQCERRIVDLFGLRDGVAELVPGRPEARGATQLDTLALIAAGTRKHYDDVRALRELPGGERATFKPAPNLARYRSRFGFDPQESSVVDAMLARGQYSVAELHEDGVARELAARVMLALSSCDMVIKVDAAPVAVSFAPVDLGLTELEDKLADGRDPHELFGLGPDATLEAIEEACARLQASIDPRAWPPNPPAELLRRAADVRDALSDARNAARTRRRALAEADVGVALREQAFERALPLLDELLRDAPKNPRLRAARLWCGFRLRPNEGLPDAIARMRSIIERDTTLGEARVYLGAMLAHAGERRDAIAALEAAVALDPGLVEAQQQLRELRKLEDDAPRPARTGQPSTAKHSVGKPEARRTTGRTSAAQKQAKYKKPRKSNRHPYLQGHWLAVWVLTALVFAILLGAQIVLRSDF